MDPKLVRSVSRSFSLSLLGLPKAQRRAVTATYLAARLADTITDCGNWSTEERLQNLELWQQALRGPSASDRWVLKSGVGSFASSEANLLLRGGEILRALETLPSDQGECCREVLKTLVSAMQWDLKTFAAASSVSVVYGCRDSSAFDWYTFSIAGCVGRFWVKIFGLPQHLDNLAVEYGKSLQRINILRDFREDWSRGRVYLPQALLADYEIDEREPWHSTRWDDLVRSTIRQTQAQLRYGANFCDAIPYYRWRLRFASMMPFLIGQKTLDHIIATKGFAARVTKTKISRSLVRGLIIKAGICVVTGKSLSRSIRLEENRS